MITRRNIYDMNNISISAKYGRDGQIRTGAITSTPTGSITFSSPSWRMYYSGSKFFYFRLHHRWLSDEEIEYNRDMCIEMFYIGGLNNGVAYNSAKEHVYVLIVYTRALSQEEVEYNYEIDKRRFNIE